MNKLWKLFQYGYLIIALLFIINAIYVWNNNKKGAYIRVVLAIFIGIIFFVKRKFRKKIEQRNDNNQNN